MLQVLADQKRLREKTTEQMVQSAGVDKIEISSEEDDDGDLKLTELRKRPAMEDLFGEAECSTVTKKPQVNRKTKPKVKAKAKMKEKMKAHVKFKANPRLLPAAQRGEPIPVTRQAKMEATRKKQKEYKNIKRHQLWMAGRRPFAGKLTLSNMKRMLKLGHYNEQEMKWLKERLESRLSKRRQKKDLVKSKLERRRAQKKAWYERNKKVKGLAKDKDGAGSTVWG